MQSTDKETALGTGNDRPMTSDRTPAILKTAAMTALALSPEILPPYAVGDAVTNLSTQTFSGALKEISTQIQQKIELVRIALKDGEGKQWEAGDGLLDLVENCGCKMSFLATKLDYPESTLSQYLTTARAFPPSMRHDNHPFYRHLVVAMAARRVQQRVFKSAGKPYSVDLSAAMVKCAGLRRPFDIIKKLRDEARAKLLPATVDAAVFVASSLPDDLLDHCHLMDVRDIAKSLLPKSIHFINLDPPYASYRRGSAISSGMAALSDCDNDSPELALQVTCESIKLLEPTLVENGCMMLWQDASALRWAIGKAIEDAGLICEMAFVWDKLRPALGWPESAFSQRCEFGYLLTRKGESARNYDGSDRDNIRDFAPVRHDRADVFEDTHVYQKPENMMGFLAGKLSPPGGVVGDFFGCSGGLSIASHRLRRRWIYVESNPTTSISARGGSPQKSTQRKEIRDKNGVFC